MGQPIALRQDYDATLLRRIARESEDADQVRRLLALAVIYEEGSPQRPPKSAASRCKWCAIGCCGSTRMALRG
jgi:hypothetical protein